MSEVIGQRNTKGKVSTYIYPYTIGSYYHWIILDHVGSCWIILDHIGSYRIILDHIGSYWIILDHIGSYSKKDPRNVQMWEKQELFKFLFISCISFVPNVIERDATHVNNSEHTASPTKP